MNETKTVRGYKVFNPDWTCQGKQYACPGKFEENVELCVCKSGMHFCKKAANCFNYYSFDPDNKVAEVIACGSVIEDGDKYCTDKLEIVREIPWQEVLKNANTGKGCTGLCNSGDWNSGDWNSGDWNSGDWNSGNRNSGDWNSGNWNIGNRNSGDWNKTDFSNGCFNTVEPRIYLFNKPSKWTYSDWRFSEAQDLLNQMPSDKLEYVWFKQMTDAEKKEHPYAETTGGYLKKICNSKKASEWWKSLDETKKMCILSLPNFDKAIFKEITGIDVNA